MQGQTKPVKPFGVVVRARREALHLTQQQVASAIGTSMQFVSGVELGSERSAAPDKVVAWAIFLGLNPRTLLRLGAPTKMHLWADAIARAGYDRKKAS